MILAEGLTKVYHNYDRREGLRGAVLDLFKRQYRTIRAVDDVSFRIQRGEMVGYIGANGAGKSTTIKMLTGILLPTSGRVLVNGLVPSRQRYAHTRQIGVVFGQRTQLWWDLAVIEAFNLLQKIYQVPRADFQQRLERAVAVLDINEQLHTPVRKLSLGQRMKCDLCASLLHNPPLLFLDEPTIGLDVAVKERIRRFIRFINREEGNTVVLTTHDMTDIEELCPRIIFIDQGRLIYDGATQEIKERFGHWRRVVLDFQRDYPAEYRSAPLPAPTVPISFSGQQKMSYELQPGLAAELAAERAVPEAQPPDGVVAGPEQQIAEEPMLSASDSPVNGGALDEPGARQFMARLAAVMDNGDFLPVKRLSLSMYQVSFNRQRYSAREVIGLLLEKFEVSDLALHDPELSDIVREIYEGRHSFADSAGQAGA